MTGSLAVGDVAPSFSATDHRGRETSLALVVSTHDWVVLWWYPKAGTSGCTKEAANFLVHSQAFADRKCALLGISFDTVEENARFAAAQGLRNPLLSDVDKVTGQQYQVLRPVDDRFPERPRRRSFLIDRHQVVRRIYDVEDAGAHPAEILSDLDRLTVHP